MMAVMRRCCVRVVTVVVAVFAAGLLVGARPPNSLSVSDESQFLQRYQAIMGRIHQPLGPSTGGLNIQNPLLGFRDASPPPTYSMAGKFSASERNASGKSPSSWPSEPVATSLNPDAKEFRPSERPPNSPRFPAPKRPTSLDIKNPITKLFGPSSEAQGESGARMPPGFSGNSSAFTRGSAVVGRSKQSSKGTENPISESAVVGRSKQSSKGTGNPISEFPEGSGSGTDFFSTQKFSAAPEGPSAMRRTRSRKSIFGTPPGFDESRSLVQGPPPSSLRQNKVEQSTLQAFKFIEEAKKFVSVTQLLKLYNFSMRTNGSLDARFEGLKKIKRMEAHAKKTVSCGEKLYKLVDTFDFQLTQRWEALGMMYLEARLFLIFHDILFKRGDVKNMKDTKDRLKWYKGSERVYSYFKPQFDEFEKIIKPPPTTDLVRILNKNVNILQQHVEGPPIEDYNRLNQQIDPKDRPNAFLTNGSLLELDNNRRNQQIDPKDRPNAFLDNDRRNQQIDPKDRPNAFLTNGSLLELDNDRRNQQIDPKTIQMHF